MSITKNENPLISILIPVFNVSRYLEDCLNSVICQTYSNIEIIIVDDGSSDSSGEICDVYEKKDSRVRVVHKANEGQAATRNLLVDLSRGEYLVFVDSDDIITPTYIEDLYELTQKYDCKIAATVLRTFKDGETVSNNASQAYTECCISSLQAIEWMNYQTKLDTWPVCKIYHKSVFGNKNLRYPLFKISEDLALTFVLLLESDKVAYLNKPNYYYRLHNNSTDGKPFSNVQMDAAIQVIEYMDQYQNVLQPILKSYICRKVSFTFRMLLKMPEGYDNSSYFFYIIKANRLSVLLDSKARPKTRFACLVSFFGVSLLKSLFKIVDKRK